MFVLQALVADTDWGHMDGWGGGWMWLWGTLMMLGFVAVVALVVWAVVRSTGQQPPPADDTARQILDERYARGELNTDEYRERVDALK